jgi:hypothetical protein
MRRLTKIYAAALLFAVLALPAVGSLYGAKNALAGELPPPQLVTGAWMFMAAYKADPEALKALLPEGLETTGNIVINMYTASERIP